MSIEFKLKHGKRTEDDEQADLIRWAKLNEGKYPELAMLIHIPNGGYRHISVAKRMKLLGLSPGVPDLQLFVPRNSYHGLLIEMKTKTGRVSPIQKAWIEALNRQGYMAIVCHGFEDAKNEIERYLKVN